MGIISRSVSQCDCPKCHADLMFRDVSDSTPVTCTECQFEFTMKEVADTPPDVPFERFLEVWNEHSEWRRKRLKEAN